MLPKQYRLKNRSAFKATYKVKNSSHKGGVTLFAGILKKEDTLTKELKRRLERKSQKNFKDIKNMIDKGKEKIKIKNKA